MLKALPHLSLAAAKAGKIARLDAVAAAYQRQVQVYVDTLTAHDEQEPDPYADDLVGVYGLSERWLRCAWQHACGILLTG